MNGTIIIDKPEAIAYFRLITIIKGVEIYIDRGIKVAVNFPTCRQLRQQYNLTGRTYKELLVQLKAMRDEIIEDPA